MKPRHLAILAALVILPAVTAAMYGPLVCVLLLLVLVLVVGMTYGLVMLSLIVDGMRERNRAVVGHFERQQAAEVAQGAAAHPADPRTPAPSVFMHLGGGVQ